MRRIARRLIVQALCLFLLPVVACAQAELWDKYVADAEVKLKAAGVKFVEADKAAFYKATQPVRDKYGAKYAALLKRIEETS